MAAKPVPHDGFYVYALFREDGITPFYIGMGCRNRWLHHERGRHGTETHKNRIINRILATGVAEVPKAKLIENITRDEAAQIERDLICLVGRYPKGPLANRTDGGEGLWNPDEACREKMRIARKRYVCSDETKAKLSAASQGKVLRPRSDAEKENLRTKIAGFRHTQEAKNKISARSKLMKLSPERIEALRQARAASPPSAETIERWRIAATGRKKAPEDIVKWRAKIIGRKHTSEVIAKMKVAQSNRSPETRAKISESAKRRWEKRRHQNALPSLNDALS